MARDLAAARESDRGPFDQSQRDFQPMDFQQMSECFVAMLIEAVEERRLESGTFDSAPPQANPAEQANSGRTAIYGTTFGHPAETRFSYRDYTRDSKSAVKGFPTKLDASRRWNVIRYFLEHCLLGRRL